MTRFLPALALLACLPGTADAGETPVPVRGMLCDSAEHAIAVADRRAKGESEELARDRVGRVARAEVCGHYRGVATVESEAVTVSGGVAYKLTAFRFLEDRRVAWLAETSFAPFQAARSL